MTSERITSSEEALMLSLASASGLSIVTNAVSRDGAMYPKMTDGDAGHVIRNVLSFVGMIAAVQPSALDAAIRASTGPALDVLSAIADWSTSIQPSGQGDLGDIHG